MPLVMRFFEDVLQDGQVAELGTATPRAIYVAAGSVTIEGDGLASDDGLVSVLPITIAAGSSGACLWRWEIADASDQALLLSEPSYLKMQPAVFEQSITATHLLRLDSVAFPAGGCAFLHTHQGPGIRCLIEGTIQIDCEGHSSAYGPGSPWFEAGPDAVFAQADADLPSRFIRAMVLPRELAGKSSIHYVNDEDRAKPKSQTYKVFDEKLLSGENS